MIATSFTVFLVSFVLVCYTIRKTIYISKKKHLFDEPSEDRKIHRMKTPNLGGAAIFSSVIFTSSFFLSKVADIENLNYIVCASVIIFFIGLTDDLVGMSPYKKFAGQLIVAGIVTIIADLRFTSLYGMFGITSISLPISILLSVLFFMLVINAFNLIDGINWLAGCVSLFCCLALSYFFWKIGQPGFLTIALALSGSLCGFLIFNRTPARIFMGDSGSLFLGFIIAVLSIKFIELNKFDALTNPEPEFRSAPALVFAILIVPVFDTLRVFSLRIIKKKSPFTADRNHLHHRLIEGGYSHLQSTGILLLANFIVFLLAFFLQLQNYILLIILGSTSILLSLLADFMFLRKSILLVKEKKSVSNSQIEMVRHYVNAPKGPPQPPFSKKQKRREALTEL